MFTYRTKSIGILTISGIIDRIRHIYISDLFLFKLLPFKRRKCLKQSTLGADMLKSLGNCLHLRRKRLSKSTNLCRRLHCCALTKLQRRETFYTYMISLSQLQLREERNWTILFMVFSMLCDSEILQNSIESPLSNSWIQNESCIWWQHWSWRVNIPLNIPLIFIYFNIALELNVSIFSVKTRKICYDRCRSIL